MELLKWARANGAPWDAKACVWAAGDGDRADGGSLEALIWLVDNGCPFDYHATHAAAERREQIQIVSWLEERFGVDSEEDEGNDDKRYPDSGKQPNAAHQSRRRRRRHRSRRRRRRRRSEAPPLKTRPPPSDTSSRELMGANIVQLLRENERENK
jgi:hypothetical protein